jgi:hypothetical protein
MIAIKKVVTILAALVISANSSIQAQDCLWAKSAGGTPMDVGNSVCTDASGNVYVTGYFTAPTINFGTFTLINSNNSGYYSDIFIVKYGIDGTVLWAKSEGGFYGDNAESICIDTNGNFYITGSFSSDSITIGSITLFNAFISSNTGDVFIAKYTPNGTVLWAKSAGGNNYDYGQSVSIDISGNVYMSGNFISPSIIFGTTNLTNEDTLGNSSDIFIIKYATDGTLLWSKSVGGNGNDNAESVSTDANGNLYINGYFFSPTITFGTTTLSNAGNDDIFIVKYNSDGTVLWAKSIGGTGYDYSNSVAIDANGNAFLTGSFSSPVITFGTTSLSHVGYGDIFIAKYTPEGTVIWAKSAGGTSYDYGQSVSTDISGNVYMSGNFRSPSIAFGTTTLVNVGNLDNIFIAKYSTDGNGLWAKSVGVGGNNVYYGSFVSSDSSSNVYIIGTFFSPSITFGSTTLANADNSGDYSDFFIAKYSGVSTGIIESLTNNQLIVSPNPTNSSITLAMPNLKNSNVSITTLTGKEVGSYTTQNTSTQTIDISHLASGVYFVSLKSEEGMVTKKIIKKD